MPNPSEIVRLAGEFNKQYWIGILACNQDVVDHLPFLQAIRKLHGHGFFTSIHPGLVVLVNRGFLESVEGGGFRITKLGFEFLRLVEVIENAD